MSSEICRQIFIRLQAQNPSPTTELIYQNSFELLVAVMLSAQATDISVNKATKTLFAAANTPAAMLELGQLGIREHIRSIGLYNTKAKHIAATCRMLVTGHAGTVPRCRAALMRLPGVGRKTANVVLNTAFGESTIAVDTHIYRVANRTGIAIGNTPRAVEDQLLEQVPVAFHRNAHHWLILHGRYICTAKKPKCFKCVLADLCLWPQKTVPEPNPPGE